MNLLKARLCSLHSLLFIRQKFWCHFILREVLSSTDQIWRYYTVEDDLDQPVFLPSRAWITGVLHDAQFIQCWVSNPGHPAASYPSYLQPSGESISPVLAYSKSSGIRASVAGKVAQWLVALDALAESLNSLSSRCVVAHNVELQSWGIWPPFASASMDTACTRFTYIHADKIHVRLEIFFKRMKKMGKGGWLSGGNVIKK